MLAFSTEQQLATTAFKVRLMARWHGLSAFLSDPPRPDDSRCRLCFTSEWHLATDKLLLSQGTLLCAAFAKFHDVCAQPSKLEWTPNHTDFTSVLSEYGAHLDDTADPVEQSALPTLHNLGLLFELWAYAISTNPG